MQPIRRLNSLHVSWRKRIVESCRERRARINLKPWCGWGCLKPMWQCHFLAISMSFSRTIFWQKTSGKLQGGYRDQCFQCWGWTSLPVLSVYMRKHKTFGIKEVRWLLGTQLVTKKDFCMQWWTKSDSKQKGILYR